MRRIIDYGETLRLYVDYTDIDSGEPVDPISLSVEFRLPDDTTETIAYPHADFVRVAQGSFFIRKQGVDPGTHHYKITAALTIDGDADVRIGKFDVESDI